MRNGSVIAVVIPALNEEAALPGVIARIPEWVDRIVVVDNGSTDRTAAVARAAGAVVVSEPTRGYGRACQAGIIAAETDPQLSPELLVFLDADGSDFPEQMERVVDPIIGGCADMVIGSRTRGVLNAGAMTAPQRFGNLIAPALIRCLWGERYTDLGPFRAIRVSALRSLRMDDNTYGWTVQMQIRAARVGLRTLEVPVDYGCRRGGESKISGTIRGVVKAGTKILACVGQEYFWPKKLTSGAREALGVFAKYPEPGRAKTRLIPALGAAGAAGLHDSMVRHTLARVSELLSQREVESRVYSAGTDPDTFAHHFKTQVPCVAQSSGDLGQRMLAAFRHMLREATAAVIIGTDCPDISPGLLGMAFEALRSSDVVLGPASDGGYYLIGLRRPVPALFENMEWSTATVLAKTLELASSLGLSVRLLPTLNDIDEPPDLPVWDRVRATFAPTGEMPSLSVIIPTLNEQGRIGNLVDTVRHPGVEVIVADGGSDDNTRSVAAAHGARVIIASRGRGPQLNAGAALARGQNLLFLHADTTLPENFGDIVRRTLSDSSVAVGAFRFKLDRAGVLLRVVEIAVQVRCGVFKTPYGDQALFMRRDVFTRLMGFAAIPLMEDLDLVRRARMTGRVTVVDAPAITSARRWEVVGVMRMTAINQACVIGFSMGMSPQRLATWRNRLSGKKPVRASVPIPCAGQIVPEGSLAPNAARAICMASSDLDVRK
ncbi:MAG: TIGR04283 family arsenosugar biosynthesis glycosyltransferase [Planctomycetota bacterium]